jgi:hypothetical protein
MASTRGRNPDEDCLRCATNICAVQNAFDQRGIDGYRSSVVWLALIPDHFGYRSDLDVHDLRLLTGTVRRVQIHQFDQTTAFITGGLFPLLFSIKEALSENADTFTDWWRLVKEKIGRLFRRRQVLINF